MAIINVGDKVRHKKIPTINGGLAMNVYEVEGTRALCEHFESKEGIHKQDWFDTNDLEVVIYGEGGFLKM